MYYRLLVFVSLAIATLGATLVGATPEAAVTHRAGVVVQFGDGHVATACVPFVGPSINGFDLLQQSQLQIVAQTDGGNAIVCKIGQQGCAFPSEACFCQCEGGSCHYWAYWHLVGSHWQFSTLGASASVVQPGGVDGWAWGGGAITSGAQPPVISFDQICPAAALPTAAPPPMVPPTRPLPSATSNHNAPPPTRVPPTVRVLPTANVLPPAIPTATTPPAASTSLPTVSVDTTVPPPTTASTPTPTGTADPTLQPTVESTAVPIQLGITTVVIAPPAVSTTPVAATALTAGGAVPHTVPTVPTTTWGSYLLFGVLFSGLLLAIIVVRRRQP